MNGLLGRILYGALFCLVLPGLLVLWSQLLDSLALVPWSVPLPKWSGTVLAAAGGALLLVSLALLTWKGGGLPMNAFPTKRYVFTGPYHWLGHPIYVGFVLLAFGGSVVVGSAAGFWVVSPLLTLAVMSFVAGYEGPATRARLGPREISPWLSLPVSCDERASIPERIAAGVLALLLWGVVYSCLSTVPTPAAAIELRTAWEYKLSHPAWSVWIYSAIYPIAVLIPFILISKRDLRRFVISSWIASLIGFAALIFLPFKAEYLDVASDPLTDILLKQNRMLDAEWMALPAFHAYWATIAAFAAGRRWPAGSWLWWGGAGLIWLTCVLAGQHSVADVVAGAFLGFLSWSYPYWWPGLVNMCGWLSNAWVAKRVGQVRFVASGTLSGLAAFVGALAVNFFLDKNLAGFVMVTGFAGLIAAAAWGYLIEGGDRLSRPFGYFGFLAGAAMAVATISIFDPTAAASLAASGVVGGALGQGVGRLRCLVQGCCHGQPVSNALGIRVVNRMSRVVALEGLSGVAIHPTQLYSLFTNLAVFLVLSAMWAHAMPWSVIVGSYLILTSLGRFWEERYRGESLTPKFGGLSLYQWLSVACLVFGIAMTTIASAGVQPDFTLDAQSLGYSLILGLLAALAMGVDFPDRNWPLSRLAPKPPAGD